ncbi:MAG: sporulation protein [Firmicutes bacterium]|nr:sporulation protein [Bacillota bacterium]
MLACLAAMPAAAATVTIVQGRVIECSGGSPSGLSGESLTRASTSSSGSYRYIVMRYRDPVTGNAVYRKFRVRIPVTPDPRPEPPPAQPPTNPDPPPVQPPDPKPEPPPAPTGLTAEEKQMYDLVNKERVAAGLKPLEIDMRLVELARLKSQDMSDKGYFDHLSPTYGSPFDMMKKAGITYRAAGENLAGAPTVEMAHNGLMNSPGHRANILNTMFTHIGIGVAKSSRYGLLFTQMFIAKP